MKNRVWLRAAGLLLGVLLVSPGAFAQELKLEWAGSGAGFDSYVPRRIQLDTMKPGGVWKLPSGVTRPLFGQVFVGPKETRVAYTVLLDEPEDQEHRLFVDANGNGDLSDETPVKWERVTRAGARTSHRGSAKLRVKYGGEVRVLELAFYRQRPTGEPGSGPTLHCYRQWGYRGKAVLGGKTYTAALDDRLNTGDFRGSDSGKDSGVFLLLDINGDGRFESRGERLDIRKPFNIGGTTYEVTGLSASGAGVTLVKSSQAVAETKPSAILKAGAPSVPFVAETTDGRKIRFPDDYRGKIVLLDFWATWCGPCLAEMPNLKKIHAAFNSRGFEVVGISLDKEGALGTLEKCTRENGMSWPQIFDGKGWDSSLAISYDVTGIPQGFLVDGGTGLIMATGPSAQGASLRTAVEKALGARPDRAEASTASPPPSSTSSISWSQPRTPVPGRTPSSTIVWSNPRPTPGSKPGAPDDQLLARAAAAARSGKLLTAAQLLDRRRVPAPGPVQLLAPSTTALPGRAVARKAREGYLRAGWYYLCQKCNQWHLKLSGGYAIAQDTFVTAWHVMTPPSAGGQAYAIALDSSENIVFITAVLAASEQMDAIVLRVAEGNLKPLALNPEAEAGDPAYCFSDPLRQRNYFSAGIVNRFYLLDDEGAKGTVFEDSGRARMNVSTDWGPGSSGAAVLDSFGNAIGHVATIRPLFDSGNKLQGAADVPHAEDRGMPLMTLHDAIPAKSVLKLLRR